MQLRPLLLATALLAGTLGLAAPAARALPPGYSLEVVHDYLNLPTSLRFAPDGRLFFIELTSGRVMAYPDTSPSAVAQEWATIPVSTTSERGLLGIVFHPDFPDSPFVYFYHTTVDSPRVNRVVRMTDSFGVGTNYTVLLDSLPGQGFRHHGGRLAFGPDRLLYVTTGEQGDPANAGNTASPMGKILRLDFVGKPAPGNPFGSTNPVYAIGVRNSFGICFDPVGGEGYFTDNGPECDDELNHLEYAVDYGWSYTDSCDSDPPGTTAPMWRISPTVAPTGCCIYRGSLYPGMSGNLFFGSFNDGTIRRVVIHPGVPSLIDTIEAFVVSPGESMLDITQGPDGRLWYTSFTRILRIKEPPVDLGVGGPGDAGAFIARPNPFTGTVALSAPPGVAVRAIEIVDLSGRRLRSWREPAPGVTVWDGRDRAGREAPAGVYFVRAETAAGVIIRRLVRLSRP